LQARSTEFSNILSELEQQARPGDYVLVHGGTEDQTLIGENTRVAASNLRSGVAVWGMVVYTEIDKIESEPPQDDPRIGWIAYDYEPCDRPPAPCHFSPEFTTSEPKSLAFFDRGRTKAHQVGMRFMAMPSYADVRLAQPSWSWAEVAQHVDALDVQLQSIQRTAEELTSVFSSLKQQVTSSSSTAPFFPQLSLNPKHGALQDDLNAVKLIEGVGLGSATAILIQYPPAESQLLAGFLNGLTRN
jgi:hypothetical protein